MELIARRQLGTSVGRSEPFVREPAREPCARVLIEMVVEVAMGFNSCRRGVVACRMGSSLNRLSEHNGLIADAVGMVYDLDAADMNGSGRHRSAIPWGTPAGPHRKDSVPKANRAPAPLG